ncbi:MAG: STAS domain-containing protein [Gammaproteobacteria bacterium]|nr:STAS domain-containing protein [Gammaproteobacteria bacterium]
MAKKSRQNKSTQQDNTIDCGDLLDISMVNEINQKLKDALSSGDDISIDISNIERIDTAGAQMLCAFYQDAKSKKIKCEWTTPSDIFSKSIKQLGLSEHFELSTAC